LRCPQLVLEVPEQYLQFLGPFLTKFGRKNDKISKKTPFFCDVFLLDSLRRAGHLNVSSYVSLLEYALSDGISFISFDPWVSEVRVKSKFLVQISGVLKL